MSATEQEKALAKLQIMARATNVHLYDETFNVWPLDAGVAFQFKDDAYPNSPTAEVILTETQGELWYRVRMAEVDGTATDDVSIAVNEAFGKLESIIRLPLIRKIEEGIHVMDGDSPEGKAAMERAMAGVVRH